MTESERYTWWDDGEAYSNYIRPAVTKRLAEYEDIGTVSEFRELKEKKYDCDIKHLFGECSYAETGCSDCIGKLKIKDALGKATAKKIVVKGVMGFDGEESFCCPNCGLDISQWGYGVCIDCGQKLLY